MKKYYQLKFLFFINIIFIAPTVNSESDGPTTENIPTLNASQSKYARIIFKQAHSQEVGKHGCQVGMVAALGASNLRNLANKRVPASLKYPHDGFGSDQDSVGLFQQRPNHGCGAVKECMDPTKAANDFYSSMKKVKGWQTMDIAVLAQKVQRTPYPDRFRKLIAQATKICSVEF